MKKPHKLIAALLFSALLIILHQYLLYGKIFELDQILHHETVTLVFIVFAAGIFIGYRLAEKSPTGFRK